MFDWEELRQVNHIIEQLRATSGTNDKIIWNYVFMEWIDENSTRDFTY